MNHYYEVPAAHVPCRVLVLFLGGFFVYACRLRRGLQAYNTVYQLYVLACLCLRRLGAEETRTHVKEPISVKLRSPRCRVPVAHIT